MLRHSAVHLSMYILRRDFTIVQITIDFTRTWKARISLLCLSSSRFQRCHCKRKPLTISTQNFRRRGYVHKWEMVWVEDGTSWCRDDKNSSMIEKKKKRNENEKERNLILCSNLPSVYIRSLRELKSLHHCFE